MFGNLLIMFGLGRRELASWELVVWGGVAIAGVVTVVYAVQERERGVPEYFREWTGWQRLAKVTSVAVFVIGVLTAIFA
jgi:hypothetical protein